MVLRNNLCSLKASLYKYLNNWIVQLFYQNGWIMQLFHVKTEMLTRLQKKWLNCSLTYLWRCSLTARKLNKIVQVWQNCTERLSSIWLIICTKWIWIFFPLAVLNLNYRSKLEVESNLRQDICKICKKLYGITFARFYIDRLCLKNLTHPSQ